MSIANFVFIVIFTNVFPTSRLLQECVRELLINRCLLWWSRDHAQLQRLLLANPTSVPPPISPNLDISGPSKLTMIEASNQSPELKMSLVVK